MSTAYTEITLKNGCDVTDMRRGRIKEPEIRQVTVTAMIDTGAWTLIIDEAAREKLGLESVGTEPLKLKPQGNRIINPLKKKRKSRQEKTWRGNMDIRTELSLIPDPRLDRCKKHTLVDILLLCIIAMVCGVESVEDIVFFGETHENWLRKYLALPHGIPSADTILRVLGRIDHRKFEGCFLSWARGYFRERMSAGSVIAVDGKTVWGE
jgi:hypothetical protein